MEAPGCLLKILTRLRILFLLSAISSAGYSQVIGGGVKGGLPLSDAFAVPGAEYTADKPAYTVGPFLEIRLPARFAIETGALYEGLEFRYNVGRPGLGGEISKTTASTWQFPLLLKYRFTGGVIRPFVSGGVAAYRVGSIETLGETISQLPSEVRTALSRVGNSFVNGGGVVAGGVEFKLGPLRIAPEVRFSRWVIDKSVGTQTVTLRMEQSRTHFLVGFGF